jgi:hypothetical protein
MNPKKYVLLTFFILFINIILAGSILAVDVEMPDYTILSVTPDRYSQVQGGNIVLTAVVKNVGDGPTLRTSSLVWEVCTQLCGKEENWSIGETDTISGLKVGQEEIETYVHEMAFGPTQFRIRCDYVENNPFGVIVEKNEDDNYSADKDNNISQPIEITTEYPDLAIATFDENGAEPMIWWSPKFPLEGQEVTFYAGITNRGKGGTVDDFEVEFIVYLDENPYKSVSLGKQKYKDGIPLGPMQQNETFCTISAKDTWPAVPGTHQIEAFVNASENIDENTNLYENKSHITMDPIAKTDLIISNAWWVPEVPIDGEEVTFYASVENLGLGGSILEFDVDFILTENDIEGEGLIETSLGSATVKDQIIPAQKKAIHTDGSGAFEEPYVNEMNWKVISGSVSIESHCAEADNMCVTRLQNSNLRYVRLSGANSIIRSKYPFSVDNDTLVFRAIASGSGKRWLSLCEPDTNCLGSNQLLTQEIATSKDNWLAYVMDISALSGKQVICEIKTGTSTNTILKVDDIRMTAVNTNDQPVMVAIPFSDVWEAIPFTDKISFTPGSFKITAKLSENNQLLESDDKNQDHSQDMQDLPPWIEPADYDFVSMNVSPPSQFIGKNFVYEVVIKNYGGPTLIDSNLNWYLSVKEDQFGSSLETDEIPGLAHNEPYVHTYEMPVVSGNINIHAFINDDLLLKEKNSWAQDDSRYNRASDIRFVNEVDLCVKKIWWRVENPLDGQDPSEPLEGQEVRFYARIDNIAQGGAVTDFDVQFIVDEGQFEEVDLKTTTIKDDILFGRLGWSSQPDFTNAGFEGNCIGSDDKLCGWTIDSGSVSAESYCGIDDTLCICSRADDSEIDVNAACNPNTLNGNLHYARLSGGGTKFHSGSFFVNGDIIEFRAQVTGSGTKKLRLCDAATKTKCIEQTYSDKSFWNAYVLDVSNFIGQEVFIELSIEGSGNMEFWVDDFRMDVSTDNDVFVTTAVSKDTWAATTGSHNICVIADVKNVLTEPDDYDPNNASVTTNNVKKIEGLTVNQTNYEIIQPASFSVFQKQIQGREVDVMAEIKNIGSGTSLETDLYWYTCLDSENPSCGDRDNWKNIYGNPTKKEKVPALSEGQTYTSIFTYTAEYGFTYVIAEVNPELNVSETYINNNTVFYDPETEVNKPKLAVQSIWWIPENPKDGEEVTFYAAIENTWSFVTGGTLDDFEVNFIVRDQTNPTQEEDLGTTKIKDDILMADRRIIDAFNKGVFATKEYETKELDPWQKLTGSVSLIDRCYQQGKTCEDNITNRYYARLYGANTLLRSNSFDLVNDIIIFSGYTNGSGTKTIRIKQQQFDVQQPSTDPILFTDNYTEKLTMRANLMKMPSGHTNDKVYIEALTRDAANAEFVIDDFRMTPPSTDNVFVSIVASNKVWTAKPGSFDISVAVSVDGAGGTGLKKDLLSDDTNDNTLIKKADYTIIGPIVNLDKQVQGEDIQATACIKNIGAATLVESEIEWVIQWEGGSKTTKIKLEGLSANQTYTSTFTFTPEYGPNNIKVTADVANAINEVDKDNNVNTYQITIDKPELEIGSIWWSPASPKDGDEVTFFARIDNTGKGGTSDDIEVRFLVSQGQTGAQVEISKEKVTSDISFALGTAAFANSDFSGEDSFMCNGLPSCNSSDTLKHWDVFGEVFAESRCTIDDSECTDKIIELVDTPNMFQCGFESYARLYGNTSLRSGTPLNKMAVKYILFKAYTAGSGNKTIQILDSSLTPVIELPITDKAWAAKIIDVAPYNLDFNGKDYYFQAVTEGAANAALMIDDIRLVSTTENTCRVMVAKVQASKTWIAQPKLSDSANDYYIHVEATDNTKAKVTRSELIDNVLRADYQIRTISHTPQEQTKGKTVTFVALLENIGAETLVESELSWFTCYANCDDDTNWKKIWKEQQTETISPLDKDKQYTSTFVLTTAFGNNHVRVFCDSGEVIVEDVLQRDENGNVVKVVNGVDNDMPTNKNYINNNIKDEIIEIEKPDLRISKIGHYPKNPVDGENVVFYAQIENIFDGGTIDEIETTFLVTDVNDVETTMVAEKSGNEVLFARRQLIFENAGFELGAMTNWTKQGTVFIEKESLTDYKVIKSLVDARNDQYFAKIYGDGSKLLSQPFTITLSEKQSIIFKGQTTGSGTKQVSIRKCSSTECSPHASDPILLTKNFNESSPWRTCILDVKEHNNQYVYLEIKTSGAANAEFWVDDFRMKDGTAFTYVSTVQTKDGWTAFPGNHTVRATVDSKQAIPENDETNNFLEATFNLSNAVDYSITSLTYTPEEQIQGKEIVFTAFIENITDNSTLIESELQWYVCQGEKKYCDFQKKWVSKSKEKITGLAAGGVYTSTFNMEVTYNDNEPKDEKNYLLQVKVVCDSSNALAEDNGPGAENNNESIASIQVYYPDLEVGDIWWIPENPVYGEAVRFYARIDNKGQGGSIQDFEVNFTVDYENTAAAKDLGETKITTEIPFGLRKLLGNNPSFELGLTSWTRVSGNVSWKSKCPENDLNCPGTDRYGDLYYASVYGKNSIFQSETFPRTGNSLIFRGMTEGAGTKKLVIFDGFGDKRIERTYTDKSPWHAYVIDIQKDDTGKAIPVNTELYIQIQTSGVDTATFMVDDFRIGEDNSSTTVVGYVESKSTWSALPDYTNQGVHTITAIIDKKNVVKEVNDLFANNSLSKDLKSIGRPDYNVTITDYTPRKQIQGRNIDLTAVIENPLSTTLLDSEVQWFTCQDSKLTCQSGDEYAAYWKSQKTEKLTGGIAEGQKYTVFYSMTVPDYIGTEPAENPDGYTIYVKVKADSKNVILEKDDANLNEFIQQIEIDHPDLVINNVWWIPKNPIDGQEVIFYAQIKNQGSGGTLKDYEVNFFVDSGLTTEENLGTAKMQDDILFGNRLPLESNAAGITKTIGDFETNTILSRSTAWPVSDWTRYSGEVYITNHFEETALPDETALTKSVENKKYLYVSGTGAKVQSPPFLLLGDALMFRAKTNGSGNKTLRIRPLVPNPTNAIPDPLIERNYNDKAPWRAYLIDIEKWHNIKAYLEIETSAGLIQLDDFRMIETLTSDGAINVGTAFNSKTWLARHGAKITVVVDAKNNIFEQSRVFDIDNINKRISGNRYTGSLAWSGNLRKGEDNNIFTKQIILSKNSDGLGDINGNGKRDLADLIIATQIVANFNHSFTNSILMDNVDVDDDNRIGLAEIIYLMVYIAEDQNSH